MPPAPSYGACPRSSGRVGVNTGRFIGRTLLDAFVHLPLVLPPVAVGYVLLLVFGMNGTLGRWLNETFGLQFVFTKSGAALATAVMTFPLMVRAIRIALEGVDLGLERSGANAGRRPIRPIRDYHPAFDATGHPGRRRHRILRSVGRIRRSDHLRLKHPWRNANLAAGAVHRDPVTHGRCDGDEARRAVVRSGARRVDPGGSDRARLASQSGPLSVLSVSLDKRRDGFALKVAFDVPTPGIVALFGRSGCGKSTTIDLIAGLLEPDAGHVKVDGVTLVDTQSNVSVRAEQRRIGYVFQDARLFPHLSVVSNLQYGQKRARDVEQRIGFDEVVSLLGLGSLLERRPNQLSGGEKQRVALGRALLSQPRLLLLDEPLASLDAARREEVLPYLEALRDRLSIPMIFVSHQFDEVLRLATHVVLLDRGQVAAQGSTSEVSLSPALRAIVGPEAVGAVLDGVVMSIDSEKKLAELRVGGGTLRISSRDLTATGASAGATVRVQLLARDIILATEPPHSLSVRNSIAGVVDDITPDDDDAVLVRVDIGGETVLSRITTAASEALQLQRGSRVWVLIKAVSMRGHAFTSRATTPAS